MSQAKITDINLINQAFGNLLPPNSKGNKGLTLNSSILAGLRIIDEQDHIQKYRWINVPPEIEIDFIERLLYYRGSGMFFYLQSNNKFYFLPYTGYDLDVYGRFMSTTALPFNGTANSKEKGKDDEQRPWIEGKRWEAQYKVILPEDLKETDLYDKCVILSDYSRQLPQKVMPRWQLSEPLLQVMAECVPLGRTALINGTGVTGYKIPSADDSYSVYQASNAAYMAAINGDKWVPIVNEIIEAQLPDGTQITGIQDYLLYMQSLDNLRLSMQGLSNGGLFQKKAHMLGSEQDMNAGKVGRVIQNGLDLRQQFCNIINSVWGAGIWCEYGEAAFDMENSENGFDSESEGEEDVF